MIDKREHSEDLDEGCTEQPIDSEAMPAWERVCAEVRDSVRRTDASALNQRGDTGDTQPPKL